MRFVGCRAKICVLVCLVMAIPTASQAWFWNKADVVVFAQTVSMGIRPDDWQHAGDPFWCSTSAKMGIEMGFC